MKRHTCELTTRWRGANYCKLPRYLAYIFWHSILAFYLTSFLAFVSGIASKILSGILSGIMSSEFLCGWGPAGNTLIRSSRWRSGGERSDPEVAVGVRRTKEEEGGGRRRKEEEEGGLANIKSNNPHLTGGENEQNKHETNRTRRSYRSCDKRISM